MLTFMRRHARSWFIKVLLGTVIVVFIFFYGFNLRERAATLIASVNGTKIGLKSFQAQYQRLLKLQQRSLPELSPDQIRALKEVALDQIINDVLLLEQAERWRFTVGETELRDYIRNIPAFQEDGQFSLSLFRQVLRFEGQTEETFSEELQRSLLIQKTENFIRDSAKVTQDEVDSLNRLVNEKLVLDYVVFGPEPFLEDISLTQEEVQEHFSEHREDYVIPEAIEVEYLQIDPQAYLSEVQVTDQELKERYQSTQDRWKVSKRVLARHILLRTVEDEDPKARMKVLQKAENLLSRLQEGEDFEELAKEYSDDLQTASQGGLLGWKSQGELSESLEKALFEQMSPGQLSDRPIKSPEGFHILKLDEVQSESIRPLEEIKDTLEDEIKQDKARQRAFELAERAYMAIFQGASFTEAARQIEVALERTEPFSLVESSEGIPGGSKFREAAFSLKDQEDFSDMIEEEGAFFILHLLKRHPSREPELDEVEEQVREDLREIKGQERAKKEAFTFIETIANGEKGFSELAGEAGYEVMTSPPLGRFFQQSRLPRELIRRAFALPSQEKLVSEPFSQGIEFFVAMVKERLPAAPEDLEKQRQLYRSMLLREKRESTYREWLDMIRSRSEIKTYKAFHEML